jgi:hypothetical protein
VVAPLAVFALALVIPGGTRKIIPRLAILGMGAALVLLPWLARNFAVTNNPLYPFFGNTMKLLLPTKEILSAGQNAERMGSLTRSLPDPARVATFSTFLPEGDAGAIGIVFFGFLPVIVMALFSSRRRKTLAIGIAFIAVLASWAAGPPIGRYFLPGLALLAVLFGIGWQRLHSRITPIYRALITATLIFALGWGAFGGSTAAEMERIECTLGYTRSQDIMRRWITYWPAINVINTRLPENAKVLLVAESRTMYLDRDVIVEDPFRTPMLVELAQHCNTPQEMENRLRALGVTHVLINRQEAHRMARLNQKDDYFSPLDPEASRRLKSFIVHSLKLIFEENGVEVYILVNT